MPMVNLARDLFADAIIGGTSYNKFNNTNARIGAGDSSTAYAASQTGLQAATNKFYQPMDATYPSRAANVLTFRATFATGDGNYAWNEWGIFNGNPGEMLSRKVESLGTKTSAVTRQITATITIAIGT